MVIDFHAHYFPEKVRIKAVAALTSISKMRPFSDGSIDGLKTTMQEAGIDYSVNLPLATSLHAVEGINRWAAENNKAPVFSLGSIHPDTPNPDEICQWIKSLGLKGVKMHPEFQSFTPTEKRLDKIWEACIKNDILVVIHAGADHSFQPPFKSNPSIFLELYKRYPELKMVVAHMGSAMMWEEAEEKLLEIKYYFDTAFAPGVIERERMISMIKNHGPDRILFGTDAPWCSQKNALNYVRELPFSKEELDAILYKNAAKLLGLE